MNRVAALVVCSSLVGCAAVGPDYQRPAVSVPDLHYGQAGPAQAASLADLPWWDVFKDKALRSLIEEALHSGYDARIAEARVEEARARFGIAQAQRYPAVDVQAGVSRSRSAGSTDTDWTANVSAGWEVDIWGRVRRLNESAKAQYLATTEARHAVTLELVAEVASTYFELRELDEELAIASRTRSTLQDTSELFERRLAGGTASALETARARAALATVSAQIPTLEREIVAKENQISVLLGRVPGPIARGEALAQQPVPPEIPAGLPAALLMRRPDLREAEQLLVAANANVGVARADFYPTLSLTGLLGGRSSDLTDLLSGGKQWSLGAGLLGPVFQGGRIRSQYRVARAQWDQARLLYEQSVTNALAEASTALVALQKLAEAETLEERTVAAFDEAVRLANKRYVSGLSTYFEVLDAIQQLLVAQNSLAQTRRDRLVALAQFYKVLGGGWEVGGPNGEPEKPPRAVPGW
jgi:outer membrane protein, multidrug efflux system